MKESTGASDDDLYDFLYTDLDLKLDSEPEKDSKKEPSPPKRNYEDEFVEKLQQENRKLREADEKLRKNLDNLLRTARNEIKRKNDRIADLQKEIDNLMFRRAVKMGTVKEFEAVWRKVYPETNQDSEKGDEYQKRLNAFLFGMEKKEKSKRKLSNGTEQNQIPAKRAKANNDFIPSQRKTSQSTLEKERNNFSCSSKVEKNSEEINELSKKGEDCDVPKKESKPNAPNPIMANVKDKELKRHPSLAQKGEQKKQFPQDHKEVEGGKESAMKRDSEGVSFQSTLTKSVKKTENAESNFLSEKQKNGSGENSNLCSSVTKLSSQKLNDQEKKVERKPKDNVSLPTMSEITHTPCDTSSRKSDKETNAFVKSSANTDRRQTSRQNSTLSSSSSSKSSDSKRSDRKHANLKSIENEISSEPSIIRQPESVMRTSRKNREGSRSVVSEEKRRQDSKRDRSRSNRSTKRSNQREPSNDKSGLRDSNKEMKIRRSERGKIDDVTKRRKVGRAAKDVPDKMTNVNKEVKSETKNQSKCLKKNSSGHEDELEEGEVSTDTDDEERNHSGDDGKLKGSDNGSGDKKRSQTLTRKSESKSASDKDQRRKHTDSKDRKINSSQANTDKAAISSRSKKSKKHNEEYVKKSKSNEPVPSVVSSKQTKCSSLKKLQSEIVTNIEEAELNLSKNEPALSNCVKKEKETIECSKSSRKSNNDQLVENQDTKVKNRFDSNREDNSKVSKSKSSQDSKTKLRRSPRKMCNRLLFEEEVNNVSEHQNSVKKTNSVAVTESSDKSNISELEEMLKQRQEVLEQLQNTEETAALEDKSKISTEKDAEVVSKTSDQRDKDISGATLKETEISTHFGEQLASENLQSRSLTSMTVAWRDEKAPHTSHVQLPSQKDDYAFIDHMNIFETSNNKPPSTPQRELSNIDFNSTAGIAHILKGSLVSGAYISPSSGIIRTPTPTGSGTNLKLLNSFNQTRTPSKLCSSQAFTPDKQSPEKQPTPRNRRPSSKNKELLKLFDESANQDSFDASAKLAMTPVPNFISPLKDTLDKFPGRRSAPDSSESDKSSRQSSQELVASIGLDLSDSSQDSQVGQLNNSSEHSVDHKVKKRKKNKEKKKDQEKKKVKNKSKKRKKFSSFVSNEQSTFTFVHQA